MDKTRAQMIRWAGDFGDQYTDRNALSLEENEANFRRKFGFGGEEFIKRFLERVDRSSRILEVGANIGIQLRLLQKIGFENLFGFDVNSRAVGLSRSRTGDIEILQASALHIPFKDGSFDLILTAGLLIHIHPSDLFAVMQEIHRCTSRYIWGFEYHAEELEEILYRGNVSLCWKGDYARLFCEHFEDLQLEKIEYLKYLNSDNVDSMYLLRKID